MVGEEGGPVGDMDVEEFRRAGHEVVDWIAGFLEHPEEYPVLSKVSPGDVAAQMPKSAPTTGEPIDAILEDFRKVIVPGITHWNHPAFFAYFANTGSAPGILGELLTAALNVNAMLWKTSPAATEVEEVTLDWLRQLLGLPEEFKGVITDTASISTLISIAAARQNIPALNVREKGLSGRPDAPRLRVYASDQAHSSVEKACITLGIGQEGLRKIPSDAAFRMDVASLDRAVEEDRAAGWLPFCVVATTGTTSTTSVDPVREIARISRRYGLWLHVDGAYGGSAAVAPEFRYVLDGCEAADSLVMNPHKWLFTPTDCSVLYVQRPEVLKQAFSLVPEYLVTESEATNYMDWGVQLGRRFRALKLWMILRTYGQEGLAANIRSHVALAREFAGWVDASPDFEQTAPSHLSVVCFRAHPAGTDDEPELERLNAALMNAVNATGEMYISHSKLNGRYTLRLAIGNIRTERRHVAHAWELLNSCLDELA